MATCSPKKKGPKFQKFVGDGPNQISSLWKKKWHWFPKRWQLWICSSMHMLKFIGITFFHTHCDLWNSMFMFKGSILAKNIRSLRLHICFFILMKCPLSMLENQCLPNTSCNSCVKQQSQKEKMTNVIWNHNDAHMNHNLT
jgi:hypothetical protein